MRRADSQSELEHRSLLIKLRFDIFFRLLLNRAVENNEQKMELNEFDAIHSTLLLNDYLPIYQSVERYLIILSCETIHFRSFAFIHFIFISKININSIKY